MAHELEQFNINGEIVTSMAFTGKREDVWHRLGQQYPDQYMTADEAAVYANLDRKVVSVPIPRLMTDYGILIPIAKGLEMPWAVVLEGKAFITENGNLGEIESKIVGFTGSQGAKGHEHLQIIDRLRYCEAAQSDGDARFVSAGLIKDGRRGFATMELEPTVIDPQGCADTIRRYFTVTWAFDGSLSTTLGYSNTRVVCGNTLAVHLASQVDVNTVRHTSGSNDRMRQVADTLKASRDERELLVAQGEAMLRKPNGMGILRRVMDNVDALNLNIDDAEGRALTVRENKRDALYDLYKSSTNRGAVGSNGWAAYQTVVEYLDWFAPVQGKDKDTKRLERQVDGTYNNLKNAVADYILQLA